MQASNRSSFNTVVLKGQNDHEIVPLTRFAIDNQLDITFIEEMPLGQVGRNRKRQLVFKRRGARS